MQLQQQKELEKERIRMQKEYKATIVGGKSESLEEAQEPRENVESLKQRHRHQLAGKHATRPLAAIEQQSLDKDNESMSKKPKRMKVSDNESEHKHRIKLMRSQSENSKQAFSDAINKSKSSTKATMTRGDMYKSTRVHFKIEPSESASVTKPINNTQLQQSFPTSFSFDSASTLSQSQASSLNKNSPTTPPHQQQKLAKQNCYISRANMNNMINPSTSRANSLALNNEISQLVLTSNPLYWSTSEVCKYLVENKFDSNLMRLIEEQEIDGQSFLMLTLPTIQNYMNLKLGPAIKLAHLVDKLKFAYFQQFQTNIDMK
jgi:hypothetical protein